MPVSKGSNLIAYDGEDIDDLDTCLSEFAESRKLSLHEVVGMVRAWQLFIEQVHGLTAKPHDPTAAKHIPLTDKKDLN